MVSRTGGYSVHVRAVDTTEQWVWIVTTGRNVKWVGIEDTEGEAEIAANAWVCEELERKVVMAKRTLEEVRSNFNGADL